MWLRWTDLNTPEAMRASQPDVEVATWSRSGGHVVSLALGGRHVLTQQVHAVGSLWFQ